MAFKLRKMSLNLPFGLGGVEVEVSQVQAEAAWELYVELATRVSTVPMTEDVGSIREALDSLYSLFATVRSVLRESGPDVANGPDSLGPIAVRILNDGLRPFVSKWHTAYLRGEAAAGEAWNEFDWSERATFYRELEVTRMEMQLFIHELARISGVVIDDE